MSAVSFEGSQKAVERFSWRVLQRVKTVAPSLTRDDILQELWAAWCMARDRFDPQYGVPFGAYLQRGMEKHINRFLKGELTEAIEVTRSLDYQVEDDRMALHEVVEDTNATSGFDTMFTEQALECLRKVASPAAMQVIEILISPPKELIEEMHAVNARVLHARSQQIYSGIVSNEVRLNFIFDFLGVNKAEATGLRKELMALAARGHTLNEPRRR